MTEGRRVTKAARVAIRKVLRAALRRFRADSATVRVALVDDATMGELHRRFRGTLAPTDVLTFDLRDEFVSPDGPSGVDGEIVVSVDTATREARRRGHPIEAEVVLYAVHGLLHLLGYDDGDAESAADMHRLEDVILMEAGYGPVYRGPSRSVAAPQPSRIRRRVHRAV
jgi:probable rRNA maturation factor